MESTEDIPSVCAPLQKNEIKENEPEENRKSRKDGLFLYFATFTGSLCAFVDGSSAIWISPVLPKLLSNDTNINPLEHPVTNYDISLIGALYPVGSMLSPFICGKLIDGIGRKNTLLVMAAFNTCFFLVLAFASNLIWIFISRMMTGILTGGASITIAIYLSEVTDDYNRGKFCCYISLFFTLGQLYGYTMGYFSSVKYFTLLCMAPLIPHIIILFFCIPESPIHLLRKGKRHSAVNSLKRYRGHLTPQEIETDIQVMEYTMVQTSRGHNGGLKSILSHKPTRKGFIISLGLYFIKMGTGVAVLFSFLGPIFEEAHLGISGNLAAVYICTLKIVVYVIVTETVEKLGRKPLMFCSTLLCGTSIFFLGIYFFMKEHNYSSYQNHIWLPVTSICVFVIAYSIGAGPIPTATFGELFACNVRSTAVSTVTFFFKVTYSLLMALFPIAVNHIGICGCMWFFSGCSAFGVVFIYLMMPETKGKSIYEIQQILGGRKDYLDIDELRSS